MIYDEIRLYKSLRERRKSECRGKGPTATGSHHHLCLRISVGLYIRLPSIFHPLLRMRGPLTWLILTIINEPKGIS